MLTDHRLLAKIQEAEFDEARIHELIEKEFVTENLSLLEERAQLRSAIGDEGQARIEAERKAGDKEQARLEAEHKALANRASTLQ